LLLASYLIEGNLSGGVPGWLRPPATFTPPAILPVPVNSLADITNVWPYLLGNVSAQNGRGGWVANSYYVKDDAVFAGGACYLCAIKGPSGSSLNTTNFKAIAIGAYPAPAFKVEWTDGAVRNGELAWYGPDNPRSSDWRTYLAGAEDTNFNDLPEFQNGDNLGPYRYTAIWTYRKKSNWPTALRLTWTTTSGDPPVSQTFEVVAPLPQ
jgi:hypothetical protein